MPRLVPLPIGAGPELKEGFEEGAIKVAEKHIAQYGCALGKHQA